MLWIACLRAYGTYPKILLSGLPVGLRRGGVISKMVVSRAVHVGGVLCF
jgi:hypothetical protein